MQKSAGLLHLDSALRTAQDIVTCPIWSVSVVTIRDDFGHGRLFWPFSIGSIDQVTQGLSAG
tara:strand:+ start:525 stop:710 length:186 start_codon:yes stop_codon:yes gene_type:complete